MLNNRMELFEELQTCIYCFKLQARAMHICPIYIVMYGACKAGQPAFLL